MYSPEITIYITNYNYAAYIQKAIESVLAQSFKNYEIIIIDDGSTDDSQDIIETYSSNPKIAVIYQKNKGLNVTNNIALRVAKGKYIVRLDADDYLAPDMLEELYNTLENDPTLGLVFPDYYIVDKEENILEETIRHNFDDEVTLYDLPAHGACTMIRTEFLRSIGGYDEQYKCQDGYELWIKFTTKYPVKNVNKPLFYYRHHGSNLTSNEKKILNTRKEIKQNFVQREKLKTLNTLAIIPIRTQMIGDTSLEFQKIGDKTILEWKIDSILESKTIGFVVITSSNLEIKKLLDNTYSSEKVLFIERPDIYGRLNESLKKSVIQILENDLVKDKCFESIMICSLEYPFVSSKYYDETVNTQAIFKASGVLSVRPDNSSFYQHDGSGMRPFNDIENFTKLERESLFKATGGISLFKISNYTENNAAFSVNISHIVIDQFAAYGIHSINDLNLLRVIHQNKELFKLDD